jgi:hypothetical protein
VGLQRELSEPSLALKKCGLKADNIELVKEERKEEKEPPNESIEVTLRKIVRERFQEKAEFKIRETSSELGLGGGSFAGNGLLALLYGMQKLGTGI